MSALFCSELLSAVFQDQSVLLLLLLLLVFVGVSSPQDQSSKHNEPLVFALVPHNDVTPESVLSPNTVKLPLQETRRWTNENSDGKCLLQQPSTISNRRVQVLKASLNEITLTWGKGNRISCKSLLDCIFGWWSGVRFDTRGIFQTLSGDDSRDRQVFTDAYLCTSLHSFRFNRTFCFSRKSLVALAETLHFWLL